MDIPKIEEQFDVNNKEWTMGECKRLLRFIQNDPTTTCMSRIEKEPNHLFLPKYLKLSEDKRFYEWKLKDLNNIFVAIFQFLHKYYPDMNRLELRTKHSEKIGEWNMEYPKYLKDKDKKKEAKMQDKIIKEVNDKWLPGFE